MPQFRSEVTAVKLHPDKDVVASASQDATVKVWTCSSSTDWSSQCAALQKHKDLFHAGQSARCLKGTTASTQSESMVQKSQTFQSIRLVSASLNLRLQAQGCSTQT